MPVQPQIAVFGCGYWGKNLVRNLHQMGCLALVCDPDPAALESAHAIAPGVNLSDRFETALECRDITGIMLATPAVTHHPLGLKCLQAGKHLFVEKPLALRVADARDLAEAAERAQLTLMVGHLLEYHPAVLRLRELLVAGHFGKLQYIYSNRLNFGKIRTEENALWSFAPHDVAVLLRLTGEFPEEVTSVGASYVTPGLADVTVSTLRFPSGIRAHIHVSWLHPFKEQKLVLVGRERMATFDDTHKEDKLVIYDQQVEWKERIPTPRKDGVRIEQLPSDEPLRRECEHFMQSIRDKTPPLTDARSGIAVLRVLMACQESLHANGRPIRLPPIP
jgi:UDP-2-acetamido-3-amino-2,3-dideoxy-glucuronate N-acetyltransferase